VNRFGSKRPRFLLDLAEELAWLRDNAGAEVAERWYGALRETIHFIKRNPRVGRKREDLTPAGIRCWRMQRFPRWLIFYAVTDKNKVVFYRVRSGTMNLVVMKNGVLMLFCPAARGTFHRRNLNLLCGIDIVRRCP